MCSSDLIGSGSWGNSSGDIFPTFEKNSFTFSGGTSYADVRDVAAISVELMEKNIFGERFIIISENRRYAELGKQIRKKLGLKEAKLLSQFQLNIGVLANTLFGWLIPALRMATRSNVKAISEMNIVSNEKIKSRLNYQFIPLTESIDFHLNNYINDKKIKQ